MGKPERENKMPSLWLNVFSNSKVNGAEYREDRLPSHPWSWPTDTYLQRRLKALRAGGTEAPMIVAHNPTLQQSGSKSETSPAKQQPRSANRPVDNADRVQHAAAKEKGLVVEWEDIDERLSWFARPSNN
jgi:hypothetical protein